MTQPALALTDQADRSRGDGATPRTGARRGRRLATGTGAIAIAAVAVTASGGAAHADDQYTVRSGDTVSHIAARYGTTVTAVRSANGLSTSAFIREGQQLTIPTAAAPAVPAAPSTAGGSHTVASGETVSAIAKRYGTTVAAISAANGLDSRAFIRVGQTLTVPGASGAAAAPAAAAPAATGGTHTVASGETVSAIAKRYGTTVSAVVAANGLDSRAFIRVGQTLTVPGASGAAAAPAAAAPATTGGTHTVASGETVSAIASRYGTTVSAIVAANGLDSRAFIRVGQTLTVPGAPAAGAPASSGGTALVGNTFLGRTYAPSVVASANANKASLLAMGVPSRAQMQAKVAATARSMGVDPALAQAIAFQESGFNHTAVSPANAIGTMQVIPSSGEWASQLVGRQLNLIDPDDNVVAGVAILRQLVRTSPDLSTAIASYYQGSSSVKRNGMFSDTRRYVANVQTHMTRY
ncbi:LysM peptidoglycan-binding domain-containing protein [Cellulomonas endometrii]|uniref:LysM peptidoglycan-binding domain-containing protein n=1 Tax=Cellulomonas endometrii TaxID=3036301 RepID=UPI0024AD685F|nr:LysM peptidoglycan-binding domain-containing protein [Cellulomonas endometrii]